MTARRPKSVVANPAKSKQGTTKGALASSVGTPNAPTLTADQERDVLRFELDAARERIVDLEYRQAHLSRRLAAMLKSLEALRAEED
jgi:hypothetical protein